MEAPRVRRDALQPRRVCTASKSVARAPLRERRVLEAAAQDRQQRARVVARRGLLAPRDRSAVIAADVARRRLDDGVAEAQRRGRPQRVGGFGQTSEPREARRPVPSGRRLAGSSPSAPVKAVSAAASSWSLTRHSPRHVRCKALSFVALRADVAFQDRCRSLPVLVLDELRRREAGGSRAGQKHFDTIIIREMLVRMPLAVIFEGPNRCRRRCCTRFGVRCAERAKIRPLCASRLSSVLAGL